MSLILSFPLGEIYCVFDLRSAGHRPHSRSGAGAQAFSWATGTERADLEKHFVFMPTFKVLA
jgi:hypothetical protein